SKRSRACQEGGFMRTLRPRNGLYQQSNNQGASSIMSATTSLQGKVAVVTGGGRGIGQAITERLAAGRADGVLSHPHKGEPAKGRAGVLFAARQNPSGRMSRRTRRSIASSGRRDREGLRPG